MIQRLVTMNEPYKYYEDMFGKWGEAPPNFREVTQSEFGSKYLGRTYSPKYIEYRQFHVEDQFYGLTLEIYHDQTGAAVQWVSEWRGNGHTVMVPRYYLLGCDHDYVEVSRPSGHRSGLHTDKCKKCNYQRTYDTSD